MAIDDTLMESEEFMEKAIEHLKHELRGIRTGRASTALVEHVKIEYFGSLTDLRAIAAINVASATQLVIKPFSPTDLKAIERSLAENKQLGLTPQSDGKQIRLNLPSLSQERRLQLVSQTKHIAEQAKVAIRNARRDANKHLDAAKKEGISEDEVKSAHEQMNDLTKQYEAKVEEAIEAKRKEILEV